MSFREAVRYIAIAACSLGSISGPLCAQEIQAGGKSANDTQVQPGEVNVTFSRVYVHALKKGFGHEHAVVGKLKQGVLPLGGPNPSVGQLVFDMISFDADGPAARKYVGLEGETDDGTRKQVNENLLGRDVLDVRTYPTAEFKIRSVTPVDTKSPRGLPQWRLAGRFTLHGTTNSLAFDVDVEEVKGWHHIRGEFKILQSDYGIKPYTKAFGAVGVADELTILGDLYVAP